MRKFTTIFVTVVLCLATLAVCASAAATNCADGEHDWTAWTTVQILEDGTVVMSRSCACGVEQTENIAPAPSHVHELVYTAAVEGCHTAGMKEYWYCAGCDTHFSDAEAKYPVAYLSLATEPTVELGFVPAAEACHKPGSKAYWQCPTCDQVFADVEGTPDAIPTTRKALETPADCELAYVPAAEACHKPGIAEYWYCPECDAVYADAEGTVLTNRKNLETPADTELVHHEAIAPCHANGYLEYWYCPDCDGYFTDAAGTQITNIKNLTVEGDLSKLVYTAKVEPTATENGMNEHWYCAGCDCYFTDAEGKMNIAYLSLTIPATGEPEHVHTIAYVPATEACHVPGSAEFWYCTDPTCEIVFADEALTQVTNRKNLEIPAVVELQHIEAVAACHANGYLEHWYCSKCDAYFADAAATQLTNIKNLTVEGDLSKLVYTAKVEPTATENGMNEHWYCAGCNCFFTDAEGKMNIAYLSLTIPATGEPTSPDTGDNAIFFIVALVAVATLGVAAVSFKKREN